MIQCNVGIKILFFLGSGIASNLKLMDNLLFHYRLLNSSEGWQSCDWGPIFPAKVLLTNSLTIWQKQ